MITAPGDRIVLLAMPNDPDPIPVGSLGTVIEVFDELVHPQVWVDWDNGRHLILLPGVDRWKVIS